MGRLSNTKLVRMSSGRYCLIRDLGLVKGGKGLRHHEVVLELAWRGTQPITLPTGETRSFLEDGDEVIFRGWCERDGWARIGLGECRGTIVPAS